MLEPTSRIEAAPQRQVYTVSRLNREARAVLEGGLPLLWVEGEISNLARPPSGHLYFSLKDAQAQVRCAMFRMRSQLLRFRPENGIHVLARARVSLYEERGEFQLIVEHLEEAGDGALRRAFELLKQRLAQEGLFDAAARKTLPPWPRCVGVITSPNGAAIRDILCVLRRRFPALPVLVYPIPVQGAGAAQRIAEAIDLASRRADCDVLILARGGGSLEDLWAFNEECVARALHRCAIPMVTGIGHEIDFTIADFVADQRAATPSAAAELVSPDQHKYLERLAQQRARLLQLQRAFVARQRQRLEWLEKRLQPQHPGQRLAARMQRLDELEQRLRRAGQQGLQRRRTELGAAQARLWRHHPLPRLQRLGAHLAHLEQRLGAAGRARLDRPHQRLAGLARALEAVSPLATLGRGYAIITRTATGEVVRSADAVQPGERVDARLARGSLTLKVEETNE